VDSANRFMLDKTSEKFIVLQNEWIMNLTCSIGVSYWNTQIARDLIAKPCQLSILLIQFHETPSVILTRCSVNIVGQFTQNQLPQHSR
jgi:hypothetical protein